MINCGYEVGFGCVLKETDKALLVEFEDIHGEMWVPKSQIHADSELGSWSDGGDEGVVQVTEWYAKKKGWL